MIPLALVLVVWPVLCLGLVYILGHAVITRGLRAWVYGPPDPEGIVPERITLRRFPVVLVECPACLGFWVGLFAAVPLLPPFAPPVALALGFACYTSGAMFLLGRATGLMPSPTE